MKKFIRKPYAGKPHVRIDEGAGKGNQSLSCSTLPKSAGTKKTSILGVVSRVEFTVCINLRNHPKSSKTPLPSKPPERCLYASQIATTEQVQVYH